MQSKVIHSFDHQERSLAPDLARGFMLLLIAMAYAPIYLYNVEPGAIHPAGGSFLDQTIGFLSLIFLDNRAFTMFAVLFGFGLAVIVQRQLEKNQSQQNIHRLIRRRGFFLLLFGLVHGILVFNGEILGPYGIAILLMSWLLFRSNRTLFITFSILVPFFIITAVAMGMGTFMFNEGDYALPDYSLSGMIERIISYPISVLTILIFFPTIVTILLGMWAGRQGILLKPYNHRFFLKTITVIGITISMAGGLPIALVEADVWSPDPMLSGLFFGVQIITGVFGGIGYAALFGLLSIRLSKNPGIITRALTAAGKRSLTCYILQTTIITIILSEPLFGLGEMIHATGAALIALLSWLIGVILSMFLEKRSQPGPADALLRRLIYSRKNIRT